MGISPIVHAVVGAQDGEMAEIVNLRLMKKRQARDAQAAEAKQNRARHGRTKLEKANDRRTEQKRQALLDATRRGG
jgi:Domain of unknown function (DUF4169)